MTDHVAEFTEFMRDHGIGPASASDVRGDGKITRYDLDGDRRGSKVGAYQLTIDGDFAVGWARSHREGETRTWYSKPGGKSKLTAEEKSAITAKIEADKARREEERAVDQANAARIAKLAWDKAPLATAEHPYLTRKGVGAHGTRLGEDGQLLVPMYAEGKLQQFQTITAEGDKLYMAGARKQGCWYALSTKDEDKSRILIAEGFSTSATLREATGLPVVCAFDAGNLLAVAQYFRSKYPQTQFIFAADNDAYTFAPGKKPKDVNKDDHAGDDPLWEQWREDGLLYNTGREKALQAAAKIGGAPVIAPDFGANPAKLTDWNDFHATMGLEAVATKIAEIPKVAPPATKKKAPKPVDDGSWWDTLLVKRRSQDGRETWLEENSLNYTRIVRNHPALDGVFAWDEFHSCAMVVGCPPWLKAEGREGTFQVHPLDEADERECDYWIQGLGMHLKGALEKTRHAILDTAIRNPIHPARDYFNSLEWDGTPRLDNWLIDYIGCTKDDPGYVRAVGRTWVMAAVKRVFEPGCEFHHMLILEGPQGAGKSSALKALATFGDKGDERMYFTDAFNISECNDPDELMKVSGRLIVEIGEMAGFTKKDNETLKAFVTRTTDVYREPYGRKVKDWPRQFVLAGTYNPIDGIFTDVTGLRRYWVVATGNTIDLEGLRRHRKQLWAEAVARYKAGESIILSPDMYLKAEEAAGHRRVVDEMTHDVLRAAMGKPFFEIRDILNDMGIPVKGAHGHQARSVGRILKVNGYQRVHKYSGGKPTWGWEPPSSGPVQYEVKFEEEEVEIEL
jgi:putative DNA primase/helicase